MRLNKGLEFLGGPMEIRRALLSLKGSGELLLAVAFVGADWEWLLRDVPRAKMICWLQTTNTNPNAVWQIHTEYRRTVKLRQRNDMHAKVFIAPGKGMIVGSANLSSAALAGSGSSYQTEAALFTSDKYLVRSAVEWFDGLWKSGDTKKIEDADIARALKAWMAARERRATPSGARKSEPPTELEISERNLNRLKRLAKHVRGYNIREDFAPLTALVSPRAVKGMTPARWGKIAEKLEEWHHHGVLTRRLKRAPIARVRKGLAILFDESRDIRARLEVLEEAQYLAPMKIPTLTMLLYWRDPEVFVPLNGRTKAFLTDLGLAQPGLGSYTPGGYVAWLDHATALQRRLRLPHRGHIDRMVWVQTSEEYVV
jgi:hypothetical protein